MTESHTCRALILAVALLLSPTPAKAHPHVFVDGGVDFVIGPDRTLEALWITWLYDQFETLYMLAAEGMSLNDDGGLDEADRLEMVRRLSDWPDDFDGSAHMTVEGADVALVWPEALDVALIDGRLQLTFTRRLQDPVALEGRPAEVAFFESTYFFDFSLTKAPRIVGTSDGCAALVKPFDPDEQDSALLEVLAKLGREETSDIQNVGAFFADRIVLQCD